MTIHDIGTIVHFLPVYDPGKTDCTAAVVVSIHASGNPDLVTMSLTWGSVYPPSFKTETWLDALEDVHGTGLTWHRLKACPF